MNNRPTSDLKHSSGDLHSRLKTRKLLGVGETDDGDVHRSKLSQILGHSDQLYLRLPYGLRLWQFTLAITFTVIAAWTLVFPSYLFETAEEIETHSTLPARLFGIALLSLSLIYWSTVQCMDRDIIRISLLTSAVYFTLQCLLTTAYMLFNGSYTNNSFYILSHLIGAVLSAYYYWALNTVTGLQRKDQSPKE